MDERALYKEKLDYDLTKRMDDLDNYEPLKVIIQTEDGLTDADHTLMKSLGGKIKDNLYIINAYSADVNVQGIKKMLLSPRILKIFNDANVSAI